MRCGIFAVVLLSASVVGCHGPAMQGGFHQSPYMTPGVSGPGPGVLGPGVMPGHFQQTSLADHNHMPPPGAMHRPAPFVPTSQVNFLGVEGLVVNFDATRPGTFDSDPLIFPATHDFPQGQIYRLKLSSVPGHPGRELYPTLEIAPTGARTQAFLAHSSVPVEFTDNDFDQVFSGNFVTKVVYLPNPEFQGIAMSGVGTLVNTQLQPGVDPIVEASKRGSILAVIRMGNKDLSGAVAERRQVVAHQEAHQAQFAAHQAQMMGMMPTSATTIPHNLISGVNIPPYGVPMTKTTTGVPGPPQLPQDMHYLPNRSPILRTEPIPAPPTPRTFAQPGQPIPNPYVPPQGMSM